MKLTIAARLYSVVLVSALCLATPAYAAVDMLLTVSGVEGDSKIVPGGIDVFSYSHGLSNITDLAAGGGGAGKASFSDLSVAVSLDKATPLLAKACASGRLNPEVVLYVRKNTEKPSYLVIKLEDVLVSSVQLGGSGGEDNLGSVSVSFAYGKITTTTVIDDTPVAFAWDVAANGPITDPVPAPVE